jgi:type I protein arginine methyltransferase
LDIGAGTGILSLFAAKAGASRVLAIEFSDIADYTKEIIRDNKLDHIITLVKGKVEEVELPHNIQNVDIIISEWMGYCLFYESMLDTVLYARDKWLNEKTGMMFPDRCNLFITAIEDYETKKLRFDWLDDFKETHNLKMSSLKTFAKVDAFIDHVAADKVITNCCVIKKVDLYSVQKADLKFTSPFRLKVKQDNYIHALLTYFNVEFTQCHKKTGFSTSPYSHPTHWLQTVFYLKKDVRAKDGEEIIGEFSIQPNPRHHRDLDIMIKVYFEGSTSRVLENNFYRIHV